MKTPIEALLEQAEWSEIKPTVAINHGDEDVPYATHVGVLHIFGHELRCYRLSNGQAVFHADDIHELLGFFRA